MQDDEILGKAYDSRLMGRLLVYLRPYWKYVVVAFVGVAIDVSAELAQPYLVKIAIDRYIAFGNLSALPRLAALYGLMLLCVFAGEFIQTWTLQITGQHIMFDLRTQIYEKLQRLDVRYYDRNPVGRLMTRVTSDVDALNELFASGIITVFNDVFMLIGITAIMLTMNWRLALVTFTVLPLIVMVTQWFRRNARESYRTVRGLVARINAFLQENITGMATVQLFNREALNFE
ncbi:MAG TPA: ABC transporter ATP-binding protein, partial [Vicinamibacterales bacterium]|nr:ABC transporter ATP-binding protein [Vicinamibacterales bacterium]